MIIAIGLGCGSGQIKIIVVGVLFSLIIIFAYYQFLSQKKIEYSELINLAIVIDEDIKQEEISKIIEELKSISDELNFVSMSKTEKTTNINLDIRPKNFDEVNVIKPLDLEIKDGEFIVFVGPSGCGKSTLLRMIAGLEDTTSGNIEIDGQDATHTPPAKRGLAMVFQ